MNKLLILPAIALAAVTVAGVSHVGTAQAENNIAGGDSIVQKIADKFNLDSSEVQVVFDEHRAERHQQHMTIFEENLDQSISEGKLTKAQKNSFLEMHQQMIEKKYPAGENELQNMSKEEHMAVMKQHHEEMETWASENGIDLNELFIGMKTMDRDRSHHHGKEEWNSKRFHSN